MSSKLYRNARSLFSGDDVDRLNASEAWMERQFEGPRLLSNLQRESHLVDPTTFGNPDTFTKFLLIWCSRDEAESDDAGRQACFCRTCNEHERRGSEIPEKALPDQLIRYVVSRALLREVIGQMLGQTAKVNFDSGLLSVEDAFVRMRKRWDPHRLRDSDRLGRGDTVFATFSNLRPAPGAARDVAEAIAHPVVTASSTRDQFLFELTYSSDSVVYHRIPTVADAGWFHLFEPAPEVPPDPADSDTCFGWTKPIGRQTPQPELVHENESLRVVQRAPRFIGWLRP